MILLVLVLSSVDNGVWIEDGDLDPPSPTHEIVEPSGVASRLIVPTGRTTLFGDPYLLTPPRASQRSDLVTPDIPAIHPTGHFSTPFRLVYSRRKKRALAGDTAAPSSEATGLPQKKMKGLRLDQCYYCDRKHAAIQEKLEALKEGRRRALDCLYTFQEILDVSSLGTDQLHIRIQALEESLKTVKEHLRLT